MAVSSSRSALLSSCRTCGLPFMAATVCQKGGPRFNSKGHTIISFVVRQRAGGLLRMTIPIGSSVDCFGDGGAQGLADGQEQAIGGEGLAQERRVGRQV